MSSMTGSTGFRGSANTGQFKDKVPKGYRTGQIQQFTPEQMQLFQSMFAHLGPDSFLSKLAGGDEEIFKQIEAPALKQFSGLQGNLASRFSGMGMGARNSSGFQNTSNQAAADFAGQLQSQRQSLQQQALRDLMSMSGNLLNQRPYDRFAIKKQQKEPFWKQLLSAGSPFFGDIVGLMKGSGDSGNNFGAGYDQEFRMNPSAMGF